MTVCSLLALQSSKFYVFSSQFLMHNMHGTQNFHLRHLIKKPKEILFDARVHKESISSKIIALQAVISKYLQNIDRNRSVTPQDARIRYHLSDVDLMRDGVWPILTVPRPQHVYEKLHRLSTSPAFDISREII